MAKKFYVLDSSKVGNVTDGNGNYRLLEGSEIKTFFENKENKARQFIYQRQPNGDVIGIEVPKEKQKEVEAERNRAKYLKRVKREMGISILSLDSMIVKEFKTTIEDTIPDESADLEQQFIEKEEVEALRAALSLLTEDELYIIKALYLSPKPLTERDVAREMKLSQPAVHKKKIAILVKIRNFFEN